MLYWLMHGVRTTLEISNRITDAAKACFPNTVLCQWDTVPSSETWARNVCVGLAGNAGWSARFETYVPGRRLRCLCSSPQSKGCTVGRHRDQGGGFGEFCTSRAKKLYYYGASKWCVVIVSISTVFPATRRLPNYNGGPGQVRYFGKVRDSCIAELLSYAARQRASTLSRPIWRSTMEVSVVSVLQEWLSVCTGKIEWIHTQYRKDPRRFIQYNRGLKEIIRRLAGVLIQRNLMVQFQIRLRPNVIKLIAIVQDWLH